MTVYAKKISNDWKKAFKQYESICGFEIIHQDDIDTGEMSSREVWNYNIRWLEDVLADVVNIQTPFDDEET